MSENPPEQPESGPPPTGPASGAPVWIALKRLDAWSVGRINGVMGAAMCLILGGLYGIVLVVAAVVTGTRRPWRTAAQSTSRPKWR